MLQSGASTVVKSGVILKYTRMMNKKMPSKNEFPA